MPTVVDSCLMDSSGVCVLRRASSDADSRQQHSRVRNGVFVFVLCVCFFSGLRFSWRRVWGCGTPNERKVLLLVNSLILIYTSKYHTVQYMFLLVVLYVSRLVAFCSEKG